jgi:L-asparaginase
MAIKIIVTGGTFDKEYNLLTGQLFFNSTHVPEMLRLGRSRLQVTIKTIMMIDSQSMTDADRNKIVKECEDSREDKILITHGTDTMTETARRLGQTIRNKTIILTGAMVPYAFGSSDGLFNFGSALAFLQTLPKGVYISMNGRYFSWDNVRKNKEIGLFEEINKPDMGRMLNQQSHNRIKN